MASRRYITYLKDPTVQRAPTLLGSVTETEALTIGGRANGPESRLKQLAVRNAE
jgi:hypothetical protein